MSNYISQNEASEVALKLTEVKQAEYKAMKEAFSKAFEDLVLSKFPKDVLEFAKKYPDMIGRMRLRVCGEWVNINTPVPEHFGLGECVDALKAEPGDDIKSMVIDIDAVETELSVLKKKISCVVKSLKTVKKLKQEFPEAYEALMRIRMQLVEGNMCDDVERLRAELVK